MELTIVRRCFNCGGLGHTEDEHGLKVKCIFCDGTGAELIDAVDRLEIPPAKD